MGIIQNLREARAEKLQELNMLCDESLKRIGYSIQQYRSMFADPTAFVDPIVGKQWKEKAEQVRYFSDIKHVRKADRYEELQAERERLDRLIGALTDMVRQHNRKAASAKIDEAYRLIGLVEGCKLDMQQMTCIVKQAHNHLVLAGAGTGKTTTVVGKIKYMLAKGEKKPEEILVLSFTNASASEMKERIRRETGMPIEASTFHKLGMNIITRVNGITPRITGLNLRKFVKETLTEKMKNPVYRAMLTRYLLCYKVKAKSEFEFKTKKEYDEYLRQNPPLTMKNELVKSYGELDIANFLTFNGIPYVYEQAYETDTRDAQYHQYRPDFYLPEQKIYIEYFGIDRNRQVPDFFTGRDGKSASETYLESMQWKRKLHREQGTCMVECYAYEKMEGTLQENLAKKLQENGVQLQPVSEAALWEQASEDQATALDGLVELFETAISLMKSNQDTIESVRMRNISNSNRSSIELLLYLLEPVFAAYQAYLQQHGEIDFNDMISLATSYVQSGSYQSPYTCVIVDEYQDISNARYRLLKSLRQSRDYDLFCVGDDWQSIYRFAGSDIGFILNFSKYWGASEESRIETTYRFTQSMIQVSGDFIMQNPNQKKKAIQGKSQDAGFALGEVCGYTKEYAVEFMQGRMEELPEKSTVFLIGRYAFDARLLENNPSFETKYNNAAGCLEVTYRNRPDLSIRFLTAHKSKGLQADYVFILNNRNARMGFPSKVQDAPLIDLLLEGKDSYPDAEERRLFYVALTRARKKAFLLTQKGHESAFVLELRDRYAKELSSEHFTCPLCGGRLIKHKGPYGEFWGCSNYKENGCRYIRRVPATPRTGANP